MTKGWLEEDGKKYYFRRSDGIMVTGWNKIDDRQYFFTSKGVMVTGWNKYENKQYYFGSDGIMVTGWQNIGNKRYFFNSKGVMVTGWNKYENQQYYFGNDGVMVTGWKEIDGQWYWFDSSGVLTSTTKSTATAKPTTTTAGGQDTSKQTSYNNAIRAMNNKQYYTAYKLFSALGSYKDAASLATKCKQTTPDTGELYRNSNYSRKTCRQNLTNSLKGGYNIYVRIYDSTGSTIVSSVFIRSGKGAVIYLPEDTYLLKAAYGKGTWFGEVEMFGDDAIYKRLGLFTLTNAGSGYTWKFTFKDETAFTTISREYF